jgi:SecD/SecF fusion protein
MFRRELVKTAKEKSTRYALVAAAGMLLTLLAACEQSSAPDLEKTGYVSMVFQIEVDGEEASPGLADEMVELLKQRVDPEDQCGLQWQAVAPDRIEVRVPLPPAEVRNLREAYEKARDALAAANVNVQEVTAALALSEGRDAKLRELAASSPERGQSLRDAATAFDERERARAALAATTAPAGEEAASAPAAAARPDRKVLELALRDAQEDLDHTLDALREGNFDLRPFEKVLEMIPGSAHRQSSIEEWQHRFPALRERIDDAVAKYDAWRNARKLPCDPTEVKRLLRGRGVLEFRLLAEPSPDNPVKYYGFRKQLHERGPQPAPEDPVQWFAVDDPLSFFNLRSAAELRDFDRQAAVYYVAEKRGDTWYVLAQRGPEDGLLRGSGGGSPWRVKHAYPTRDAFQRDAAGFTLDSVGGGLFGKLTGSNIGKQLCVFVDDVAYYSASIRSRITTSGVIAGEFSTEKVSYLVQTLQAGALPARMKFPPVSERVVEPKP